MKMKKDEIMEDINRIVEEIKNDPEIRKKEDKLVKKLQQPCSPLPCDLIR